MTCRRKGLSFLDMRLGKKLTDWLDQAGWSDRELARRLKVSPSSVGRWKEGLSEPRRRELVGLARVTGLPLDYLADDEQDQPPAPEVTTEERMLLDAMRRARVAPAEMLAVVMELAMRVRAGSGQAIWTGGGAASMRGADQDDEPDPAELPAVPAVAEGQPLARIDRTGQFLPPPARPKRAPKKKSTEGKPGEGGG